nr:four-carbon acid sugar kinase family protein [Streptomyces sp. SID8379]
MALQFGDVPADGHVGFDSTPQGNIGPVTDALQDALQERATVVVPAFPATGRTVYKSAFSSTTSCSTRARCATIP